MHILSKEYKVFNKITLHIEESIHVSFDETMDHKETPYESKKLFRR